MVKGFNRSDERWTMNDEHTMQRRTFNYFDAYRFGCPQTLRWYDDKEAITSRYIAVAGVICLHFCGISRSKKYKLKLRKAIFMSCHHGCNLFMLGCVFQHYRKYNDDIPNWSCKTDILNVFHYLGATEYLHYIADVICFFKTKSVNLLSYDWINAVTWKEFQLDNRDILYYANYVSIGCFR